MNIYRIIEDGEAKCWQAETMQAAVAAAEHTHIIERRDELGHMDRQDESEERAFWHANILESCALVGELANP